MDISVSCIERSSDLSGLSGILLFDHLNVSNLMEGYGKIQNSKGKGRSDSKKREQSKRVRFARKALQIIFDLHTTY